ncbi:MAG TPA: murein biosynthesis integral membrane protein MurJ [Verrucomicrobiae bacterium]|jgi:putative peptidoglycan lipid II flippase|nr:murein biosynthesis integral membrane protein MurJ [Verrucomicrobiae bacterium]
MLKSSGAMAAATLTSRILGMVREMAYMAFMNVGWVNDAFQYAFTIPNLFRRLLGEGALTAAFIPIFKEKEKIHGEGEMWRAANAVISGLVVTAAVIIALVMLAISLALSVHHFPGKTELMLRLLRMMFPYMLLVCMAAAMMGMLNARGHFFIPAMGATMLNVVMIASVYWLAPKFGVGLPPDEKLPVQIFALAYGVLAAGVAQAAFQMPTLWKDGFRYRWVSPWRNETVRLVVIRMIPGTIGLAAFQINVALVQLIGFFVATGVVSSFNGAVRLMELPQGMFGISLATYLLPTLSVLAVEKKYPEFRTTLRHGLSTLIFVNLISSVLLVALAEPIVRLIYEHGKFTDTSTLRVAGALEYLAPGLVMFSTVNILARAFFALGDTKTPMKISMVCLALNLAIAIIMLVPLREEERGPAIANTVTSCVNVALLLIALRKKLGKLEMESLRSATLRLACLAILAGAVAHIGWKFWEDRLGHATIALRIGAVFVPAIVAGSMYWLGAMAIKIPAAAEIFDFAAMKFKKRSPQS